MKKVNYIKAVFFLAVLILSANLKTQPWVLFTGTVVNEDNGLPVPDYPVFITVNDSMFTRTTYTNGNGIYLDTVYNDPVGIISAEVFVFDCNQQVHTVHFTEVDTMNIANFSICVYPGNECQAFFNSEPDSLDPFTINFYNLSQGNYTEWSWEFGDGTGSEEINPVHKYNAPGIYQVCLSIQDSAGSCQDTYCSYIQVGTVSCIADFYWQPYQSDPLLIYFFDNSLGNISGWLWDFGDSDQSTEQFPVHQYSEAGQYVVTLTISDSAGLCYDSISKIVLIGGDTSCVADFSYELDTLNNTPYVYNFTDQSQGIPQYWLWNFGDGEVSYEQNPLHIYQQGGTYQVCLTISNNNVLGDCYDTICKTIVTPEYFDFGGQVFLGDYPLNVEESDSSNKAIAYLFRKYMNKWELMDSREFWKYGYYWFADKPGGEYIIRTDLLPGSIDYGNYSPVYYEDSKFWTQAKVFRLNDGEQYAVNVKLNPVVQPATGSGSISGNLQPGSGCIGSTKIQSELIYLMNDSFQVVSYTYTDENGAFVFNALGSGDYLVKAETTGKLSQSVAVHISENDPVVENIILNMDCNSFVSVEEYQTENDFLVKNIYPQPASDMINIDLSVKHTGNIEIQLIDMKGQICIARSMQIIKGSQHINLDVHELSKGLYLMKFDALDSGNIITKKIMIY